MAREIFKMRWEISFSLIDSKMSGKNVLYDSHPFPIEPTKNIYTWANMQVEIPEMSILDRDAFTVMINLHPIRDNGDRGRILWFPCIVQYTSLLFDQSTAKDNSKPFISELDYDAHTTLSMMFTGIVEHNKNFGRFAYFTLLHLTVSTHYAMLEHLIHTHYSKQCVVCVGEIQQRMERLIKHPIIYLSRPQQIHSSNGKDRLYMWALKSEERKWQPREDYEDLVALQLQPPLSVGGSRFAAAEERLPDHEAIHNTFHLNPVLVSAGQVFVLRFFNLFDQQKRRHAAIAEVHIKWNDFIHAPPAIQRRFSFDFLKRSQQVKHRMRFTVDVNVEIDLDYTSHEQHVLIHGVYLRLANYQELNYPRELKSV